MDTPLIYRTIVCLIAVSSIVIAQVPQRFTVQNRCTSKTNCSECIQTPSCAWCFRPTFKGTRCFQPSLPVTTEICPEEFIFNPDNQLGIIANEKVFEPQARDSTDCEDQMAKSYEGNLTKHESWEGHGSRVHGGAIDDDFWNPIVHIAPQKIRMQLRVHQSSSIYMEYMVASDFPVDLYYLMDLSRSMHNDKFFLLGERLAQTMQNITSDFTLGFGTFVDKGVMANGSTQGERLHRSCEVDRVSYYGFRHQMKLNTNPCLFSVPTGDPNNAVSVLYSATTLVNDKWIPLEYVKLVKQANVSQNVHAPEGRLGAIMQAVVCRNDIGWRGKARRLLVFSTDASFQHGEEEKLDGKLKPYDGYCHMNIAGGNNKKASYQEYPSIEQINLAVQKNSINVIFAVNENTIGIYDELAKQIEGASTAKLDNDSDNIVELIKEQYEHISSTVEMKHNASGAVSIRFFSQCLNASGAMVNTNICRNVKVGDVVRFKVDIELQKCPDNPKDRFQTIQIYPVGNNKSLTVELEMICECNCEKDVEVTI